MSNSRLKDNLVVLRRREVQMLGAALSLRDWHSTEVAYDQLRDRIDNEIIPAAFVTHTFPLGTRVTKIKGSSWTGRVVGYYSTKLTPDGVCVESETETGSVQIYPTKAMRAMGDDE